MLVDTSTLPPPHCELVGAERQDSAATSDSLPAEGRSQLPEADALRSFAWDVGERKPADTFAPTVSHVGLAMVCPGRGFAHWRILTDWIRRTEQQQGGAWHDCRMILRLYDVSFLEFNGLNAHCIQDHVLPAANGRMFFDLPHGGTSQLAEVGFLLRSGEFLPAARSQVTAFASGCPSPGGDRTALLVDERGTLEEVGNLWDQERILIEHRTPKLRTPLRIAAFAFPPNRSDSGEFPGEFLSELASGLCERGHELHVFLPACDGFRASRSAEGVQYHPLDVCPGGTPLEQASSFAQAAEERFSDVGPFDLIHLHEWMTARGSWFESTPTILSLSSIEATRRGGSPPNGTSQAIEDEERAIASRADCVLTPDWLRETALAELDVDAARLHAFPMEGRLPNEWECPLDCGQVKGTIGVGPLDRLMLFVGPLEHAAGVDLILEALGVLLHRWPNLRVAFAGSGEQYGAIEHRTGELGLHHAVRLLGHVESAQLTRLLRASEALILPSRYRVPFDDAVVDLARRAGRPVITTQGGPAHLVRHEETGIVTYDNSGSIVWAMDRLLGDPAHAQRMGESGRCSDGFILSWNEVSRCYLELCAAHFPQLTVARG